MFDCISRRCAGWLAAGLVTTASACGDSPSAPGSPALPLLDGRYAVGMIGFDFSLDPDLGVCAPIGVPMAGKNLQTTVDLRREGSVSVARSTPGAGDLVLRLEVDGAASGPTLRVKGTAAGNALWSDARFPARDLRARVEAASTVSGDLLRTAAFVNGRITGSIIFSDSTGASSTCPMVLWTLQPD